MAIINLEGEKWEDIPGYEEFYQVSNFGRVKSKFRYARSGAGMRRVQEKLMTQTVHPDTGHCRVQLSKRGKMKTAIVYRLVLEVIGQSPKPAKHEVLHIDGNRENNSIENIRWIPEKPKNSGEKSIKVTLNDQDVNEIRMLRQAGLQVNEIATKMQISKGQVSKIVSGKSR